jgi:hypothetical protein
MELFQEFSYRVHQISIVFPFLICIVPPERHRKRILGEKMIFSSERLVVMTTEACAGNLNTSAEN